MPRRHKCPDPRLRASASSPVGRGGSRQPPHPAPRGGHHFPGHDRGEGGLPRTELCSAHGQPGRSSRRRGCPALGPPGRPCTAFQGPGRRGTAGGSSTVCPPLPLGLGFGPTSCAVGPEAAPATPWCPHHGSWASAPPSLHKRISWGQAEPRPCGNPTPGPVGARAPPLGSDVWGLRAAAPSTTGGA